MRVSVQERIQASVLEPAQEQAVLERKKARRRWTQALASVRRYPSVAQQADPRLQLSEVSKVLLDGATCRRARIWPFLSPHSAVCGSGARD